jgi:hypothetical protein
MAEKDEEPLLVRTCVNEKCGGVFFLCRRCDRGQRYCSEACRNCCRQEQRRRANRKHQQSPEGRLDHLDRQRAYRERLRRVTDQSSESLKTTVILAGRQEPEGVLSIGGSKPVAFPWPPRCRICGRQSRWVVIASW